VQVEQREALAQPRADEKGGSGEVEDGEHASIRNHDEEMRVRLAKERGQVKFRTRIQLLHVSAVALAVRREAHLAVKHDVRHPGGREGGDRLNDHCGDEQGAHVEMPQP
jgi:hypothetical protein